MSDELRKAIQAHRASMAEIPDARTAPAVMGDIAPYRSMITGELITSRSQHREHLKAHGCIEVGSEVKTLLNVYKNRGQDVKPAERKELIRAQVDAMTHREFRAAIKRDIDRVKWNSRSE